MRLSTQIEIATPPAVVREKFLDFSKIPTYSPNGFFKSLSPAIPNKSLEVGDKMHNVLEGMTIDPIVRENSPTSFRWYGSFHSLFNGEHMFHFQPSKTTPGGTTFIHEEEFSGPLAFMIGEGWMANAMGMRKKTQGGFEGFNRDLKKWCESDGVGK